MNANPEIISIDATLGKEGQLLHCKTGEPLKIKPNTKFKVILLSENIEDEDILREPKSKEDQIAILHKKPNIETFKKIASRNSKLYFVINQSIVKNGEHQKVVTLYTIELLEDLFIFKRRKSKPNRIYGLSNCQCKLLAEGHNIKGKSLNEIYELTFKYFCPQKKNSSVNAIDRFFTTEDCRPPRKNKRIPENCLRWQVEKFAKEKGNT